MGLVGCLCKCFSPLNRRSLDRDYRGILRQIVVKIPEVSKCSDSVLIFSSEYQSDTTPKRFLNYASYPEYKNIYYTYCFRAYFLIFSHILALLHDF